MAHGGYRASGTRPSRLSPFTSPDHQIKRSPDSPQACPLFLPFLCSGLPLGRFPISLPNPHTVMLSVGGFPRVSGAPPSMVFARWGGRGRPESKHLVFSFCSDAKQNKRSFDFAQDAGILSPRRTQDANRRIRDCRLQKATLATANDTDTSQLTNSCALGCSLYFRFHHI